MDKSNFFYELPPDLIAQHPCERRDNSRLLVLDRESGRISHKHFADIVDYLNEGDTLILNDTKVIPARIFGTKTSGAIVEFLLLKCLDDGCWECLAGPGKKAKTNDEFIFGDGLMRGKVKNVLENGNRVMEFIHNGNIYEILDQIGNMPLPPYITEQLADKDRYQTVYAKNLGSAAAPTAGLHFTDELFLKLKNKGVNVGFVTLHVGLGTFRPVKVEKIEDHVMHTESYHIPKETADLINSTKEAGKRVVCVGTTSCRTLESASSKDGRVEECSNDTGIFIYPGYSFKCMDGLITNFHLPESTLIMLVSAFAGYESTMNAYKIAVDEKYRFFSFGDAMIII